MGMAVLKQNARGDMNANPDLSFRGSRIRRWLVAASLVAGLAVLATVMLSAAPAAAAQPEAQAAAAERAGGEASLILPDLG